MTFFFFKQKTAYELRISDWSQTCALPIYYRSAIKDALDRLPPTTLVQVMTDTVEEVTLGGEDHAPELIDDLVDSYEVETQGFLQKEAENVHKLIKAARDSANSGEAAVKP